MDALPESELRKALQNRAGMTLNLADAALPMDVRHLPQKTLWERLIRIGASIGRHDSGEGFAVRCATDIVATELIVRQAGDLVPLRSNRASPPRQGTAVRKEPLGAESHSPRQFAEL